MQQNHVNLQYNTNDMTGPIKYEKIKRIYSLLISLLIMIPALNMIVIAYVSGLSGVLMSVLYFSIGISLITVSIQKNGGLLIPKINLFVFGTILLYFIISLFAGTTGLSVANFFAYTAIPLLFLWDFDVDVNVVAKTCILISLTGIPVISRIFVLKYGFIKMGVSYAFLIPSVIAIFYYFFCSRKSFIFSLLAPLNCVYTYQVVFHGSRGSVLSIAVFIFLIFALRKKKSENGINRINMKLLVVFAMTVLLCINIIPILEFVGYIANSLRLNIKFLDKFLFLLRGGDITNGRMEIYSASIAGFIASPVWGNGIGTFDFYTGFGYPHDFVLQILFDMGIVGVVVMFLPAVIGIPNFLRDCKSNELAVFILMFSISVPGALFSQDLWNNINLLVTLSFLISSFNRPRRSRIIRFVIGGI